MSKETIADKSLSATPDGVWKKRRRQIMMMKAIAIAAVVVPIVTGILWLFLAPSHWGWIPKTIVAIIIPAILFWSFVVLDDNFHYRNRKKEQMKKKLARELSRKDNRPEYLKRLNAKWSNDKVGQTFIIPAKKRQQEGGDD